MEKPTRKLVLGNGHVLEGYPFGARGEALHEIVFNSNMVGYQELISDYANAGQIVLMTYPLIGNYGTADEDFESKSPCLGGLVVREYNPSPSNFRYTRTLGAVMEENGIPGIWGPDTRMLTRMIRQEGNQKALITDIGTPHEECMERLAAYAPVPDQVARVSCVRPYHSRTANPRFNIVIIDCGVKAGVIRSFNQRGCNVTVMPWDSKPQDVLGQHPDGLVIAGGPGNPKDVPQTVELIKTLRGKMPILGLSLGHLLVCLAYGGDTAKRHLGHRGGYPVKDTATGRMMTTSQNHGYDVVADSLVGTGLSPSYINVLDSSVEGVECPADRLMTVHFYPEGAPGAQDGAALYQRFIHLIKEEA